MKKNKGITLVEVLIIVGVIGCLILLSALSLNNIRQKGRDLKRVSDMTLLQKTMDIVKAESGSFTNACGDDVSGKTVSQCSGIEPDMMLDDYLPNLQNFNDPLRQDIVCDENCSKAPCNYGLIFISDDDYNIKFYLEKGTADYVAGCHTLTKNGIE